MFIFKRYRIRSYEMGLLFRDGEFRGVVGAVTRWFFDPLGKVDQAPEAWRTWLRDEMRHTS